MKRFTIICILGLFLATIAASTGLAQTSEEIVAKMIEAQGGKAALEKIKDATYTGTLEIISMGLSGSMTMYRKEPDKARMDMELMGMVITQAFDGENAWGVDPNTGSVVDMPEDQAKELKRMAMGNEALLNPDMAGVQVDTESFVSDYKKVDGLVIWHTMRIVQEGEESMLMTFSDVVFNTGLEDSLFKKE
jgi:outer membrane lipoprotein-sorting protein